MGKNYKKITLITGTEATKTALFNQLEPLLKGYVEIECFATDTGIDSKIDSDLVVISSKLIIDDCKPYINNNCPVILARRSLNFSHLDKLFSIPKDEKVLLVNDTKGTTNETIELLIEFGIKHIEYIPYYPNCRPKNKSTIAITAGERALVPAFVEEIIDLGPRIIDLTTVVEILERLNLLDEKAHFVSAKYMETIVSLGRRLYTAIEETNTSNDYLTRVLNQVNDGIMTFNAEGKITVFNETCESLFKQHHSHILNKPISQCIKDQNITHFLSDDSSNNQLFKVFDTEVVINKFKIPKLDSTVCTIKNAKETVELENKLRRNLMKKGYIAKYTFSDIIGDSPVMISTKTTAKKLSRTELSILIHGESGTGKELFASAIHNESSRSSGPFLAVNFSALPEDLVESELFGYEEGAFTGAKKGGKIGLFEQANNGTIFLDEIGDTSPKIQARLLRVLQEKEIMKVGGTEIIPINVRIIAATNKDLSKMCLQGKFREDLYYRLKKLYLKTPPLSERKMDIKKLIEHFMLKNGQQSNRIKDDAMKLLCSHDWPGNVRELENVIEYMIAVSEEQIITIEHIPKDFFSDYTTSVSINNKQDNPSFNDLYTKGNIEEFRFILSTIKEYNKVGKAIGRKAISKLSEEFNYLLSEEQIRKRTDILEDLGYITKNKGRAGMRLTLKGISFVGSL